MPNTWNPINLVLDKPKNPLDRPINPGPGEVVLPMRFEREGQARSGAAGEEGLRFRLKGEVAQQVWRDMCAYAVTG